VLRLRASASAQRARLTAFATFWFERPLYELWPQASVLAVSTVAFLIIARLLARRWETA